MNTKTYLKQLTISEVKRANKEAGFHFFSKGAMKGFNSVIETMPNKANIFITSEKEQDWHKRRYTMRWYNHETHEIEMFGPFMGYPTIEEARAGRKKWTEIVLIKVLQKKIDLERAKLKVLEDGKAPFPTEFAVKVSDSLAQDGIENYALLYSDTQLMVELKIEEEN